MCKGMPVILINKVVDPERIIQKMEKRHNRSQTRKDTFVDRSTFLDRQNTPARPPLNLKRRSTNLFCRTFKQFISPYFSHSWCPPVSDKKNNFRIIFLKLKVLCSFRVKQPGVNVMIFVMSFTEEVGKNIWSILTQNSASSCKKESKHCFRQFFGQNFFAENQHKTPILVIITLTPASRNTEVPQLNIFFCKVKPPDVIAVTPCRVARFF
jgi:hypothetical protein